MIHPGLHDGRLAIVTGGALGIGRAYARRLAAEGARVVVADVADASETVDEAAAAGGDIRAVACDVSDPSDVGRLFNVVDELGGADILVHNAAIFPIGPYEGITFEDWRRVLSVNLDSMFLLAERALPHMRRQGWGRIVAISSAMVHAASPGALHYVTSKGGIIGFVRGLAREVGPDGVTINAIAPGLIRSHGTSQGVHDAMNLFETSIAVQAVKRTGQPEDLTGALSYLVSDEAGFVTGQTWVVDGGYV